MYIEHFDLKEYPFQLTPDTGFMYMSEAHARAKAYMDYTIWNRDGFMVITGEVGSGKTTLIQQLLSELDDSVLVAKIFQTQLDDTEFLQAVLVEYGLNPFNAKKVELLDMLNTFLIETHARFKQAVLIVDEAHNLPVSVLEEIRMLSGLETEKEKILNVILVGQPQLNEMLESSDLEQLLQRIRLRYHIRALTQNETREYIKHRLRVAGAKREDLFAANAIPLIFKYTGGIPRLINTLCDTALTCAYADDLKTVDESVIRTAVSELQWPTYEKRQKIYEGKGKIERHHGLIAKSGEEEMYRHLRRSTENMEQIAELVPLLNGISNRLISIEGYLKRVADCLEKDSRGGGVVKMPAQKKQ